MLDLSPVKLLFLFVLAVLLVGPDKLPQAARQMGAGWRKIRELHLKIDQEVRQNIPDLPSTQDIARLARSPVAFLNQLADIDLSPLHIDEGTEPSAAATTAAHSDLSGDSTDISPMPSAPSGQSAEHPESAVREQGGTAGSSPVLGDPSLN